VFKSLCADLIEEDPSLSQRLPQILTDHKAFQRIFEEMVGRWVAGRHRRPVSESWQVFTRRVCSGVERVMDTCGQGSQVAVFTSAGALSAVMQKALGLSDERAVEISWAVYNSSVSTFRYNRERRFSLVSFNSVAHLKICRDAELLTYR
jgi:broad specificity phosphatase PhoE